MRRHGRGGEIWFKCSTLEPLTCELKMSRVGFCVGPSVSLGGEWSCTIRRGLAWARGVRRGSRSFSPRLYPHEEGEKRWRGRGEV
ncbi:Os08g0520700 [Oryza sativa Japonica Group]|uniref:Os08g0520700 protein n=1 Tax=Oryza sativa subsp. japonica TaxID=39947 RepID=Q6YZV6_ORYSJ|nr:unknown protein [Oryza sativa Japonica Group]BAH94388.1 Os08g0520700 [Oryza sativa Japonica Group]|eukprot:NP_001175660.1 Os08g0520700 [Oryza sativa Japonica Group]